MAFTSQEEKSLLEMANTFHSMFQKSKNSGFASYSARPSRRGSSVSDTDPSGVIEHFLPQGAKDYWAKIKKDYIDSRVGERMKDSHDMFIGGIEKISEDLAKEGKKFSSSIVDAYKGIVNNNKDNKKLHGDVADSLNSYANKVTSMENLLEQNATGYTAGMNKEFHKLNKEIEALTAELNAAGIAVNNIAAKQIGGPKSRKWEAADKSIDIKAYASEVKAAGGSVLSIQKTFETQLESSFKGEISARAAVIASLFKFAVDIGSKFADVAESRLQNVLDDTTFLKAVRTGLTPDEMNTWNNANRNTLSLLGENADAFANESQNAMHAFGLFGKAAMDATTNINKISFNAGIGPSVGNNVAIQDMAGKLQAMQGISQQEAVQQVTEAAGNMNYYLAAAGKTDAEQLAILNNQAVNLTRIARSSGFSAQYVQGLYEEAKNQRFASIISQIKTAVTTPLWLDQLESLTGVTLTEADREGLSAVRNAAVSLDDKSNPLVQQFMAATKKLSPEITKSLISTASSFASGQISGPIAERAILDSIDSTGASSFQNLTEAGARGSVTADTMGEATKAAKFYDDQLQASKDSLSVLEDIYKTLTSEYGRGISANPFGGIVGNVAGTIGDIGLGALALKGTGLLPAASPLAGGLASGGAGKFLRGGLKGGVAGIAGFAASYGGQALKQSQLESGQPENDTIFDKETAGAGIDVLGQAVSYGATGALVGSLLGPVGTVVGGALGGIVGAASGLYDNWDTVEKNYNTVFSTSNANMVAGHQTDENGNIIMVNDELTEAARKTAEGIERQNKMWEEDRNHAIAVENKNETQAKLEALAKAQTQNQLIAGMALSIDANKGFESAIRNING